ncbi:hypothetical protein HNQ51_000178 [Inhella inkyongensis]|uniref:TIR domain-containing protein n=1 Tax=Inhella inkyongensis TaxID=392593 RepID=A0A840RY60_9BURK|nr:toll/interleukin-1 receptor domain-containing protein [Inhella inkyongensis]MBB5202885.1 hypothetical protein [Inhella inkyongensis]
MPYFTKGEARAAAARSDILQKGSGSYERGLRKAMESATQWEAFDVFLSHSVRDAELIAGVTRLLEDQGLKVYVDWLVDPQLDRNAVTKETAALLRQRMRQSKSLIFVASDGASSSKWMPWELGYFDGFKPGNVAILPLLDNASEVFRGQEYLGLYPIVNRNTYTDGRPEIFVEEFGKQWSTLKRFGSGGPDWRPY